VKKGLELCLLIPSSLPEGNPHLCKRWALGSSVTIGSGKSIIRSNESSVN
jgi:hypothetical protein